MYSFEPLIKEDRLKVLELRCFHIASQLFIVRPWQLFVEVELEEMKNRTIWVFFKRFPTVEEAENSGSLGTLAKVIKS